MNMFPICYNNDASPGNYEEQLTTVFVKGQKLFERLASQRIPASNIGSSTKLEVVIEQVTELKNQQVQMLQFLEKQQQIIVELKEALLNANTSQPVCSHGPEDMHSSD
ncbi:hypothetical protein QQ045_003810 [Rhodiola kirilowii]